jgi:hypothetical protein
MSSLLLSRRTLIKGLFVAPAIVAATNIMPIKAIEKFTLSDFDVDKSKWVLVKLQNETIMDTRMNVVNISYEPIWMQKKQFDIFHKREKMDIIRSAYLDVPKKWQNGAAEAIINLTKISDATVITMPLPDSMIGYSSTVTGFRV